MSQDTEVAALCETAEPLAVGAAVTVSATCTAIRVALLDAPEAPVNVGMGRDCATGRLGHGNAIAADCSNAASCAKNPLSEAVAGKRG